MQIWAESGKSALPICNYSQILYQFLTFTQNLKRSPRSTCLHGRMLLHGQQETDAGSQVFRLRLSDLHGHGNLLRSQNCAEEEKS